MKHTPAPWYFSNEGVLRVRAKDDDEVVCSYAGYANCEREYANAKLIAAAPDLLNELQRLRDYVINICGVDDGDCDSEHPLMSSQAAISKALGEE
ncbi:TPA: hypothetical protein LTW58_000986 [Enterobacter hormaechei]|nr:hypothetical protein [Enterobacter hormaechei]